MKTLKKQTQTAIALFLMLTITATLVALPLANAHTPAWNIPTWSYITVEPNPIGVDQTALVVYWVDKVPPTAGGSSGDRWRNLKVEVTKPDGTKETLGPFTSDPVGGGWTAYTLDQVGTYTFVFSFPGQVASLTGPSGIPGAASDYINDTYLASSATTTLTVQQEPIPQPPSYPLPTAYWTRPIEGQNTAWASIASNWLGSPQIVGRVQPDGIAPNSPHIMWAKPFSFGGVVGGSNTGVPGMTFYSGTAYEGKMGSAIIMCGNLYYALSRSDAPSGNGYVCVDLTTGEQRFWINDTMPSFGQLYDYESGNQHGVIPSGYLWRSVSAAGVTTWMAMDPWDGNWLFNLTNVPSGTTVYSPSGEILIYQMNYPARWLALWNNTAAPGELAGTSSTSAWQWRPVGKNINASTAYSWNVTIPDLPGMGTPSIVKVIPDDLILGSEGTFGGVSATNPGGTVWAISLKPTSRGQLSWIKNYSAPAGNLSRSMGQVDPKTRVFTMYDKETMQWSGYSIDNGTLLWGPTPSEDSWNFYALTTGAFGVGASAVAYGHLYSTGYSGIVYCYDLKNGSLLWNYSAPAGLATPYGRYSLLMGAVADGKIYLYSYEHSANAPHWVGSKTRCIDANTGKEIWTIAGWAAYNSMFVADSYMVSLNLYDMQIYCFGKGPSATTVTAPDTAVPLGSSVVIRGTVTDQTPSSKAKGTPAISDASMGQWMEYLYMQKPIPTNATGVEVTLDTIDPNNNFVHIGTVKSDTSGAFGYMWEPEVPGTYTVIATFAGSESYWSSYAQTYVGVSEAPAAPAAPEPAAPLPPFEMYTLYATIAIIVAIAIVGLMLMRMLRKRP